MSQTLQAYSVFTPYIRGIAGIGIKRNAPFYRFVDMHQLSSSITVLSFLNLVYIVAEPIVNIAQNLINDSRKIQINSLNLQTKRSGSSFPHTTAGSPPSRTKIVS